VKEGKIQESNDRLDENRGEILLGKLQMEQELPKTSRVKAERGREGESPQSLREETLQLYQQIHMSNLIREESSSARTPVSSRISWTSTRRADAVGTCLQFKIV
jgi:hypothetical protein